MTMKIEEKRYGAPKAKSCRILELLPKLDKLHFCSHFLQLHVCCDAFVSCFEINKYTVFGVERLNYQRNDLVVLAKLPVSSCFMR